MTWTSRFSAPRARSTLTLRAHAPSPASSSCARIVASRIFFAASSPPRVSFARHHGCSARLAWLALFLLHLTLACWWRGRLTLFFVPSCIALSSGILRARHSRAMARAAVSLCHTVFSLAASRNAYLHRLALPRVAPRGRTARFSSVARALSTSAARSARALTTPLNSLRPLFAAHLSLFSCCRARALP